ncbi:MAG: sulfite exporter TauE/SafE family protein, partial [Dehalococcoidia bacterium]|nr:sulfite exporter TauE/SafE family protein [Dehalococcoidia bacterium]
MTAPEATARSTRWWLAFGFATPIAVLGGLIGLGGAEFRLPVLAGPLRYAAKQAVPLNLAISLITVVTAMVIRANALPLEAIAPLTTPILALIGGAVLAAFYGAALAHRLPERRLEQTIMVLLVAIGGALIVEAFVPQEGSGLAPPDTLWRVAIGLLFGALIGLVSSLLGVAGGELIIPTLIFVFGAEVKAAGSASLFISLPTIIVGLARYARRGAFADRTALRDTVAPMGVGSVIGASIGGLLVGVAPSPV